MTKVDVMEKCISKIYVFKVTLAIDDGIWRRIAIQGNQTLDALHGAIFDAFDREEEHLYSFYVPESGRSSTGRGRPRNAVEYTHPYCLQESPFGNPSVCDASETVISCLELKKRQKFKYLFDFGDSWWHVLTVEQIDADPDKGCYPRTIEKYGKSPPQYPDYD